MALEILSSSPNQYTTIDPGDSVTFSIEVNDPYGLSSVDWYIGSTIQAHHSISGYYDTDSWSNTFYSSGTYLVSAYVYNILGEEDFTWWQVTVNEPPPDLTVDNTSAPSSAYAGDSISVSCRVRNIGNGSAGSSYVGYFVSQTQYGQERYLDRDAVGTLNSGGSSNESETVTLPGDLSPGTWYLNFFADYQNTVSESREDNNIHFAPITILAPDPVPTVLFPNGGESFNPGQTITVQWSVQNQVQSVVDLQYTTNNGSSWSVIANSVSGTSRSWTIPGGIDSTSCRVKVITYDSSWGAHTDQSDGTFTIRPPDPVPTVIYPNGGETFAPSQTITVQWSVQNQAQSAVDLQYTTNNGSSWSVIANSVTGTSRSWTIPNGINSTSCRVKVITYDSSWGPHTDQSDGTFTIQPPVPTVIFPNGGENFTAGQATTVQWSVQNQVQPGVDLQYTTNNGSSWANIATGVTGTSHSWAIPIEINSTSCRVKVITYDSSWAAHTDQSDGTFTISNTADLTVTVLNQNGVAPSVYDRIIVQRWQDGVLVDSRSSTTTNQLTWTDIESRDYSFDAYVEGPNPFDSDGEYWVTGYKTLEPGANSLIVQREEPYTESFQVYRVGDTNPLAPGSLVAPGTELRLEAAVWNQTSDPRSVQVQMRLDRDQGATWDFDEISGYQTVNGTSQQPFTLYFTPNELGDYQKAIKTEIDPGGKTDSWDWDVAFTVSNADLTVTVLNQDSLTPSVFDRIIVQRWQDGVLVDFRSSTTTNQLTWTDIEPRDYSFDVYVEGPNPFDSDGEYWVTAFETLVAGANSLIVQREEPYTEALRIFRVSDGHEILGNDDVEALTELRIEARVRNRAAEARQTMVKLWVDRDQSEPVEFEHVSSFQSVPGNGGFLDFSYTFTPPVDAAGQFHKAVWTGLEVGGKTDSWAYDLAFNVIAPAPPTAEVLGMNPQPTALKVGEVYSVTALYDDPSGKDTIQYCYLRAGRDSVGNPHQLPLTMMYTVATGDVGPWAGAQGEDFLGSYKWISVTRKDDPADPATPIELEWHFRFKPEWPKVTVAEGGVQFAARSVDIGGLDSEWQYASTATVPSLAYEWPGYGTTVITHGWTPITQYKPEWVAMMGKKIGERVGRARVLQFEKNEGIFSEVATYQIDPSDHTTDQEWIFLMDWGEESNDAGSRGYSEAAAEAFLTAMIRYQKDTPDVFLDRIHFIGHSRGTVVSSEMIERVLKLRDSDEFAAEEWDIGNSIAATYLDPHPVWEELFNCKSDLVNPESFENDERGQVLGWQGMDFAVDYYQPTTPDLFWKFDGLQLETTRYRDLDSLPNTGEFGLDHSEVHAWYFGTIDLGATENELRAMVEAEAHAVADANGTEGILDPITIDRGIWYSQGDGKGLVEGFASSPFGGSLGVELDAGLLVQGTQYLTPGPQVNYPASGLFNGDFEFHDASWLGSIPGWSHQGGEGQGVNVYPGSLSLTQGLLEYDLPSRTHNWMYIPKTATGVEFKLVVTDSSDDIRLFVAVSDVDDNNLLEKDYSVEDQTGGERTILVSFDSATAAGKIARLKFALEKMDLFVNGARVEIDNARFVMSGEPPPQPQIQVTAPDTDFGAVLVGGSSDLTMEVENVGAGTLSGSASILPPGTGFQVVAPANFDLGPGESQLITIRFAPTTEGPFEAIVRFTGSGGQDIRVTGSGSSGGCASLTSPSLAAPLDGQALSDRIVVMSWSDVVNEQGYVWEVFTNGCDGAPLVSGLNPANFSQSQTSLDNGVYYWRVTAIGDGISHCDSPPSECWNFTVAVDTSEPETWMTSSQCGTIITTDSTTFEWSGADDATAPGNLIYKYSLDNGTWFITSSTSKVVSGMANGIHTFEVKAIDESGNEDPTPASCQVTVDVPAGCTLLDTPVLIDPCGATLFSPETSLHWQDVANEIGYSWLVHLESCGGPTIGFGGAGPDQTTATLPTLADGVYQWRVQAVGDGTNYCASALPDCCMFTVNASCVQPVGMANNGVVDLDPCADTGVEVTWTDPVDWGDSDIGTRTFDVLRDGIAVASGLPVSLHSFVDTAALNDVTYIYQVRANNGCGQSFTTPGTEGSDSTDCCPIPVGMVNNAAQDLDDCADTGVEITWAAPADWGDGGAGTRTFDVLRDGVEIATALPEATLSFVDDQGVNEVSYTYQVRANNGCGKSFLTSGAQAADGTSCCQIPNGMGNNSAADLDDCADSGVEVVWSAPTSWGDDGSGVRSFDVFRDGIAIITDLPETALRYVDDAGSNDVIFTYQVEAKNACGLTFMTNGSDAGDTSMTPVCPEGPVPADEAIDVNTSTFLQWVPAAGAILYDVYFGTDPAPPLVASNVTDLSFDPGQLDLSTTYYWMVVAKNGCGDAVGCMVWSFTTADFICEVPAGMPNNAALDVDECNFTGVQVSWATPTEWGDNNTGTRTYDVLRDGATIASGIPDNTSEYFDLTGTPDVNHHYQVRAANGCGLSFETTGADAADISLMPGCALNPLPVDQAIDIGTNTLVQWDPVPLATSYDIYFGMIVDPPLVAENQVGTSLDPGQLSIVTTYYWKVVAKNSCGEAVGCETWRFTTVDDETPPTVIHVGTEADTGDGSLTACETAQVSISKMLVTFSESVDDPPGNTDPDDVTNPDNFRVLGTGPDANFQTDACGAVFGDDQEAAISSVAYDDGTHIADLVLQDSLSPSRYRFLVCGSTSIYDLAGNPLDGDGNGTGGDDFSLTFRADPGNLLANGHFDCDLDGWTAYATNPSEIVLGTEDAFGSTESGSAEFANLTASNEFWISQCVETSPGTNHTLSGYLLLAADQVFLSFSRGCHFFATSNCTGSLLGEAVDSELVGGVSQDWAEFETGFRAPAGVWSLECEIGFITPGADDFEANLDGVTLTGTDLIFDDGFESGDTSRWSLVVGE